MKLAIPVIRSSVCRTLLINIETGKQYTIHHKAQIRKSLVVFCNSDPGDRLINGKMNNKLTSTGKLPISAKKTTATPINQ
jgi:hypothetical protein